MNLIRFLNCLACGFAICASAATNQPPQTGTNLVLNAHQQFYRNIEIRRSQLANRLRELTGVIERLNKVVTAKQSARQNSKPEEAERKKYYLAVRDVQNAQNELSVAEAQYELQHADAKQYAGWWLRSNAVSRPRR